MSNIRQSPNGLTSLRGEYANTVFIAAALIPPLFAAAVLWILPVAGLSVDRSAMAARDYTDMWIAGHLVALGQGDTLFDLAAFNAALHAMFGAGFPHQVWPYPPPILLLAVRDFSVTKDEASN